MLRAQTGRWRRRSENAICQCWVTETDTAKTDCFRPRKLLTEIETAKSSAGFQASNPQNHEPKGLAACSVILTWNNASRCTILRHASRNNLFSRLFGEHREHHKSQRLMMLEPHSSLWRASCLCHGIRPGILGLGQYFVEAFQMVDIIFWKKCFSFSTDEEEWQLGHKNCKLFLIQSHLGLLVLDAVAFMTLSKFVLFWSLTCLHLGSHKLSSGARNTFNLHLSFRNANKSWSWWQFNCFYFEPHFGLTPESLVSLSFESLVAVDRWMNISVGIDRITTHSPLAPCINKCTHSSKPSFPLNRDLTECVICLQESQM